MPDAELGSYRVRYRPGLDHKDEAARDIAGRLEEAAELLVDLVAYRALRAMLENNNGMRFRALQKPFEVLMFSYFRYHVFRLADPI